MHKYIFLLIIVIAFIFTFTSTAQASTVAHVVPKEHRTSSIEKAHVTYKAKSAKKLIEAKGEDAFDLFRGQKHKWLVGEEAIFVIDANEGSITEGIFVVYPDAEDISDTLPEMSKSNGRRIGQKVVNSGKDKQIWFGFVEGEPTQAATATAIAVTPEGKKYVIVVGLHKQTQ